METHPNHMSRTFVEKTVNSIIFGEKKILALFNFSPKVTA